MKGFNKKIIVAGVVFALGLVGPIAAFAAGTAPTLGAADGYSVFGGAGITNTGAGTHLWGNAGGNGLGNPGLVASQVDGTIDAGADAGVVGAASTAYGQLDGQAADGGQSLSGTVTVTPGVWTVGAALLNGTVTLNGAGVYIFRSDSSITVNSGAQVSLTGGATACNVFWEVPASMTIGTNAHVEGTIITNTGLVSLANGATLKGRALAHTQVTMDTNQVTNPCAPANGTLHVVKTVVGGTAAPSVFTLHVKNSGGAVVTSTPGVSGTGVAFTLPADTYTVSEDANSSYTESFLAGDCSGGSVVLPAGGDEICTIINTNIPVIPPAGVSVSAGSGRIVPLIGIVKVPTPLALPAGSGPVTYNYTVWNVGGQQALDDVTVTDDKCSPVTYVSGDTNGNGKLDPHESWKYTCTTTLRATTTNTATAIGYSDDAYHQPTIATAVATVVVGAPITPPIINIVKVPSRLTPFPYGGGNVTYSYTVTNPGTVPMSNVNVVDDKCSPVSYVSGDANGDNLLEPGETWVYTCKTNVPVSTSDVATAKGTANGFTAVDYAYATVLVATPSLPNTGYPLREDSAPIMLVAAVLALVSASLAMVLGKRKV
jgi:uncharacterized repeat protein (TIGR01451 family)